MKSVLRILVPLLTAMCAMCATGQAYAWGDIALATDGSSEIAVNRLTPEAASKAALENCTRRYGPCHAVDTPRSSGAFVVADGDTAAGAAFDPDPAKAAREALRQCEGRSMHCKIENGSWDSVERWTALAKSRSWSQFADNNVTRAGAEKEAMEGCAANSVRGDVCTLVPEFETSERAYFAEAIESAGTRYHLGFARNAAAADEKALKGCDATKAPGNTCSISVRKENPGRVAAPPSMSEIVAEAKRNQSSITRTTTWHECQYSCLNADCVTQLPNGALFHARAPWVMDPATNQWRWGTPACPG